MKFSGLRYCTAAALTCFGAFTAAQVTAQTVVYPNPYDATQQYALLNGNLLSLYINSRGDLGAPVRGNTKSPGFVNSVGQPYINSNGSVNTTVTPGGPGTQANGTYGILFSPTSTANAGSLAASVQAKNEYLTVGADNVAEGYSLIGNASYLNGGLNSGNDWLTARNFTVQSFTPAASGIGITSQLIKPNPATSTANNPRGLQITQNVSFQNSDNRVQFSVTFKNTDTTTLTGIRYARAIDPNEGGTIPNNAKPGDTTQAFRTPSYKNANGKNDAFVLDSFVQNTSRHLGIGVLPGDPNAVGSKVLATSATRESDLLSNPEANLFADPTNTYVQLGTGTNATYVKNGVGKAVGDYTSDSFVPDFGPSGAAGLVLESPEINLAPNAEQTFSFYYFFDPVSTAPPGNVPEPGALALLASGGFCGLLAVRRRRAR